MDIYQHDVLISNKINVTELQSFHICHALNYYLKADLLITFVNQSYCTFDWLYVAFPTKQVKYNYINHLQLYFSKRIWYGCVPAFTLLHLFTHDSETGSWKVLLAPRRTKMPLYITKLLWLQLAHIELRRNAAQFSAVSLQSLRLLTLYIFSLPNVGFIFIFIKFIILLTAQNI